MKHPTSVAPRPHTAATNTHLQQRHGSTHLLSEWSIQELSTGPGGAILLLLVQNSSQWSIQRASTINHLSPGSMAELIGFPAVTEASSSTRRSHWRAEFCPDRRKGCRKTEGASHVFSSASYTCGTQRCTRPTFRI